MPLFPWPFPTASDHEASIATSLLVILVSASIVTLIFQRVRMAAIPAFLITGTLIGPHTWGLVRSSENLAGISHLAIILLLFGVGLNLHLSVLKHTLGRMIVAGTEKRVLRVAGFCLYM